MRRVMFVGLVMIGMAAPAFAQSDKPVEIFLGGGPVFPSADFKNDFNTGGTFQVGATFWTRPTVGFQVEYDYARMNGPDKTITVSPTPGGPGSTQLIQSNHQAHQLVFDVVGRSHNDSMANFYGLAGLGYYHRIIQLTSPAVGYTTICDPYWLICYPAAVSVDNILGSRSSNDFGINFGGGVTFGHEAKFYVEARYTYVWGPTITPPAGLTTTQSLTSNAVYWPITFGVRF